MFRLPANVTRFQHRTSAKGTHGHRDAAGRPRFFSPGATSAQPVRGVVRDFWATAPVLRDLLKRSRRQLPFPATPNLRVAQLTVPGAGFESVCSFPRDRWQELEAYRPQVLVGSTADLQRLAELTQRNIIDLTSVDRALFALTCCGDQPLMDVSRVVLWQAFGVPVYELFIAARGALLASECEAQEGWHVEPGAKFSLANRELVVHTRGHIETRTGLSARLESKLCPCGRPGLRVMDIEPLPLIGVRRALAAIA